MGNSLRPPFGSQWFFLHRKYGEHSGSEARNFGCDPLSALRSRPNPVPQRPSRADAKSNGGLNRWGLAKEPAISHAKANV
jgi:hypothetical protein